MRQSRLEETKMESVESARTKLLLDHASEQLNKAVADINQSQIDVANGRTSYFDRLTIGAGAVIAAIVSFLGSHAATLHPEWMLRCSLVALVVVILAGLYRSFRYPYYIMQAKKVVWIEAELHHQRCKGEHIKTIGPSVNLHDGRLIDKTKLSRDYAESNAEVEVILKKQIALREHLLKECHVAEAFCLVATGVAMISLVWLALRTF